MRREITKFKKTTQHTTIRDSCVVSCLSIQRLFEELLYLLFIFLCNHMAFDFLLGRKFVPYGKGLLQNGKSINPLKGPKTGSSTDIVVNFTVHQLFYINGAEQIIVPIVGYMVLFGKLFNRENIRYEKGREELLVLANNYRGIYIFTFGELLFDGEGFNVFTPQQHDGV